jgi:hypothetical protein
MRRFVKVILLVFSLSLLVAGLWCFFKCPSSRPAKVDATQRPTLEQLEKEANDACDEAGKRHEILDRRYPDPDTIDNKVYFESQEYLDAASWDQACDTATADLEKAKERP